MHQHFENWNDMKHEPQNFWSAELFFIRVKLFTYTISDGDSQMPLLWFFLRGGGSVHRLDSDKSRYFAIKLSSIIVLSFDHRVYPWEAKRSAIFTRGEKRGFFYVWAEYYLQPNAKAKHSWTTLRMSRLLFVDSYLQVMWRALCQSKERKICLKL